MLDRELAEKLIAQVTKYTEYNVNIIDENGIIIASRDRERLGTYHETAYEILRNGKDVAVITENDIQTGVRRGINMVIEIDGKKEGVVGVTGNPEEIRPVALIIKMAIETMIRYESEKIRSLKRKSKKERLLEMLTGSREAELEEVRGLAGELGYQENILRIPVLCTMSAKGQGISFLKHYSVNGRNSGDICFNIDGDTVLIFKAVQVNLNGVFSSYRTVLSEAFEYVSEKMNAEEISCSFFAGSFQDSFREYPAGYRHTRWLQKKCTDIFGFSFFYDYAGEYLRDSIPRRELRQVFQAVGKILEPETKESCRELTGSLVENDFRIRDAAAQLYIHKNTFAYRYRKLQDKLALDPKSYLKDKDLLIFFSLFLGGELGE